MGFSVNCTDVNGSVNVNIRFINTQSHMLTLIDKLLFSHSVQFILFFWYTLTAYYSSLIKCFTLLSFHFSITHYINIYVTSTYMHTWVCAYICTQVYMSKYIAFVNMHKNMHVLDHVLKLMPTCVSIPQFGIKQVSTC